MSTINHSIPLSTAVAMTKRYRDNRPGNMPVCETFEVAAVAWLLAEAGCRFFRIYYGMDEKNEIHAILVGANEQYEDLLPDPGINEPGAFLVIEDGFRCPPRCPPPSPLNS